MKKGRFLWSAHRITERQKAGKARSIKGKQLKNSRNTVSKQLVEHHSSPRDNNKRIYEAAKNQEKTRKRLCLRVFFLFQRKYKTVQKHTKKSV